MNNNPLDHYEITEQKSLDDNSLEHNKEINTSPQNKPQVLFLGHPSSFGRAIIAIIILLVAIIWGATVKSGDPTDPGNCFGAAAILICGLAAAYRVCIKRK